MGQITDNGRKLVEALRSGDYEQGRYALTTRSSDGAEKDCCLGVACKIAIADGVAVAVRTGASANPDQNALVLYDNDGSMLPKKVCDWLGFSYTTGGYVGGTLMGDNDGGKTFAEIADIIEAAPDILFADAV